METQQTSVFADWFTSLRDRRAQSKIAARIARFELGLMGDVKPVGGGVSEARIDFGPGYRLYFMQRGEELIILLAGGDKASQQRDIARAKEMAARLK
jgi:putative addiction module killer protein